MNRIPMTMNGHKKLQEELKFLKNTERPNVIEAIAAARLLGDFSENAEYHAAKEKQGMIEARISDIEEKLSRSEVIDFSKIVSPTIKFGAKIEIEDEETDTVSVFQIVGSDESDIKKGLLPITSPIAKALIGKKIGDQVEVKTPRGAHYYKIINVKYGEGE